MLVLRISLRPSALFLLIASLVLASPARADTYYVAPVGDGGSDANEGSAMAPWATLQHAATQVLPGDTVRVQEGTYAGFQITTSGTEANPIVFKADGASVVINAVNPVRGEDTINVEGADYVVIDGFRVRDADRAGIRVVIARGVVIQNNVVGPNGKWGIFTGFAPNVQILHNETFGSGEEHGIYVSNSDTAADTPIIRGNDSHDNQGNGIQLNGDCFAGGDGLIEGALVENNLVHHNQLKGFSLISTAGSVIQNNVIYENGATAGAGGIHLVDEPGCGIPSVENVVVNNTIHEPRIAGIRMSDGATGNLVFNNLIVSERDIRDEVGGNHIDATSNYTILRPDGLFADVDAGNYHLLPGAPPVDIGAASFMDAAAPAFDFDGTARPHDATHDAGAFEYAEEMSVAVEEDVERTEEYGLSPVYPNPFNPVAHFSLSIRHQQPVKVSVFDVQGRRVRTLYEGTLAAHQKRSFTLEAGHLPSGFYLIHVVGRTFEARRWMTLLK